MATGALLLGYSNCGQVKFAPDTSKAVSMNAGNFACPDSLKPPTSMSTACPSGNGSITQTQTVTCNTTNGTWLASGFSNPDFTSCSCPVSGQSPDPLTGTCNCPPGEAVVGNSCAVPTCDPNQEVIQDTMACPSGSSGQAIRTRTASCPAGQTQWQYGAWSDWNYSGCTCNISTEIMDPATYQCGCPAGTELVNNQCAALCPSGQYHDSTGTCVDYPCKSYVQVTNPIVIPQRSSAGVCYYMKVFNAIPGAPSSGSRLSTVLSRDHDTWSTTPSHPYILGTASYSVTLQGTRAVKLSGASNITSPILVDNYLLVDLPTGANAYGTSDSTIYKTNYILYDNNQVIVNSAGFTSGTATVAPLDISSGFAVGPAQTFNLDALDCGGSKQLSDVYLLFQ